MKNTDFILRFFKILLIMVALCAVTLLPYSFMWLYKSGDVALERVVETQATGKFAIFGSGVSQDFVDYKLNLYRAVKPEVVALGSSRVMQFRSTYFNNKFLNVGGTAGNIAVLRSTVQAMLKAHKPEAVILGLDFWWFNEKWEKDPYNEVPPTSGSYAYSFDALKKPYEWLFGGKIGLDRFFAPLNDGFSPDMYGIMAQRAREGFGSDGSWYYTADITGAQKPFDFKFQDTLNQVRNGIKAFYHAPKISQEHIDAFGEIYCALRSRGIKTFVFISPIAPTVLAEMQTRKDKYPHLFELREELRMRGIEVMDFTDPRTFSSNDCEFVDGFHGGDVAYLRMLKRMAQQWPSLAPHVNVKKVDSDIRNFGGLAMVPDPRVTTLPEVDFMKLSCPRKK